MAKISDLPSGVLSSGDLIPVVQGGVTKQVPSPFDTEANGSVGTGGDLSAWGSGFVVMEINNIEATFHDVATFNAGVAHNCYNNGTSWLRTSAGGTACRLTYSVAGGQKFELYAAAGAADSVITWTTHQILGTDGTLQQTAGIYLGGTATANLLDDYEEGTWAPTLTGSTSGTVAGSSGLYTKAGRMVNIKCEFGDIGAGLSGDITVTGFPIAFAPTGLQPLSMFMNYQEIDNVNYVAVLNDSSIINFYKVTLRLQDFLKMTDANVSTFTDMSINGTYQIG